MDSESNSKRKSRPITDQYRSKFSHSTNPFLVVTLPIFCVYLFIAYSARSTQASFFLDHHDSSLDLDYESGHSYKMVWKGPLDEHLHSLQSDPKQQRNFEKELKSAQLFDDFVTITSSQNEQYQCIVPRVPSRLVNDQSATNSSAKDDDDEKRNMSPFHLLEILFTRGFCSKRLEQYWSYELCHGKFLRQYHSTNSLGKNSIAQEFYLGKFQMSDFKLYEEEYEKEMEEYKTRGGARPTIIIEGHARPYVRINMTSGTQCDLTNKNRMSKVFYVCSEENKHEIYSLKETSTCEYEVIVLSPLLCNHEDFRIDTNMEQDITCFSVGKSPVKPVALEKIDKEEQKRSKQGKVAFFDGRTLVIDADEIGALISIH